MNWKQKTYSKFFENKNIPTNKTAIEFQEQMCYNKRNKQNQWKELDIMTQEERENLINSIIDKLILLGYDVDDEKEINSLIFRVLGYLPIEPTIET